MFERAYVTANFGGLWKLIPCDTYMPEVSGQLGIYPAVRGVSFGHAALSAGNSPYIALSHAVESSMENEDWKLKLAGATFFVSCVAGVKCDRCNGTSQVKAFRIPRPPTIYYLCMSCQILVGLKW